LIATESGPTEYTIKSGDYPETIAKNHGITIKALEAANPGLNPKKLKPGVKLHIPAPSAASAKTAASPADTAAAPAASAKTTAGSTEKTAAPAASDKTYTVKTGDNLQRIAKNHHTTAKAIAALNGLKSLNSIQVGQKLKMPAPKAAAASAPAAPAAAASPATSATASPSAPASHASAAR